MDSWQSWGIPLAAVSVLWGINSNMRGWLTPVIESLLSLALLVLVVVGFCVSGWIAGVVGFVAAMQACGVAKALSPLGPATRAKLRRNQLDFALAMRDRQTKPEPASESSRGQNLPYHNKERRFQVWLRPKGDPPPASPVAGAYRLRWVEQEADLVEKIRVFDAGLDDRLVELVKVSAIGGTEDLEKPLVFLCLDRSRDHLEFVGDMGEVISVSRTRYERLRDHYAKKLVPDQGWQKIDRQFALRVLSLRSRVVAAR